ncbi:MAG: nucleotidyl transferase AbiEii/AbiGii toxin family protein [Acidobacteriota bacterium]
MISKDEILERARVLSLQPSVVEKDYVLGWLLQEIGRHPEISEDWVFKGGTCLKKIHVETYRFSEDLDFTLLDPTHLDPTFLEHVFREIAETLYEHVGIDIPVDRLRFDLYENLRGGKPAVQGRVYYRGPLGIPVMPRIKLDLTADEIVVETPTRLVVAHDYSDQLPDGMTVLCYDYVEVFAEKVRALGERGRARDLYDVVHLFRRPEADDHVARVRSVLRQKCTFKALTEPTLDAVTPRREEIRAQWVHMLGSQLPELPPFEMFWDALATFFGWLDTPEITPPSVAYELGAGRRFFILPSGLRCAGLAREFSMRSASRPLTIFA